ncbi:hypothetical protein [Hoeflea sp. EC-HK425]|uniref:hypothetical protein n=1 Tax=Hoeflea sp. EC-HK425 TaxID=2038388 RepID=UPI0012568184|nr:hypothetical protein [Hoeflea sp. EC-HK425]VVT12283.1 conserved hypothetical protein [Hoeflea sp. EC-HK425]
MTRAETTYLLTAAARKAYADEFFDLASVAAAIDQRAEKGHRFCRLIQDQPFDLRETKAAQHLQVWLDDEAYRYIWRPTPTVIDPLHPAPAFDYPELEIQW